MMENARVSRNGSVSSCQCPGALALSLPWLLSLLVKFQVPTVGTFWEAEEKGGF